MDLRIESKHLGDVCVLAPQVFQDDRGFFTEVFRADQFQSLGLPTQFVQDNHSGSVRGVLRGLHFQWEPPMGKLMRVTRGSGVSGGRRYPQGFADTGKWFGTEVSGAKAANRSGRRPVLRADSACSPTTPKSNTNAPEFTTTKAESGIRWNDPAIGIEWPLSDVQLSDKDRKAQHFEGVAGTRPNRTTFRYSDQMQNNLSMVGR